MLPQKSKDAKKVAWTAFSTAADLLVFGSPGGAGLHDAQSKTSRCDVSSKVEHSWPVHLRGGDRQTSQTSMLMM